MLALQGRTKRVALFNVDQAHRPPARCVSRAAAGVVGLRSGVGITGATGVEGAVGAAEDVDEVGYRLGGLGALRLAS